MPHAIKAKSHKLKTEYADWKRASLRSQGWFPLFQAFKDSHLARLSGTALKVYLYLGLASRRDTGVSWHSIETMSEALRKSTRTISAALKELEAEGLIVRLQGPTSRSVYTYLVPYYGNSAEIGKRVLQIRMTIGTTGMSQAELSRRTGLPLSWIDQLEGGVRNPTVQELHQLSGALGVDISDLTGRRAFPKEGHLDSEWVGRVGKWREDMGGLDP